MTDRDQYDRDEGDIIADRAIRDDWMAARARRRQTEADRDRGPWVDEDHDPALTADSHPDHDPDDRNHAGGDGSGMDDEGRVWVRRASS